MRVLIACEYSGIVRDAFIARGHDAMSCDLLPTDAPGPHYQGDVFDVIGDGWDMMIAHPPCTYLSVSGMHWTTRGLRDPKLTEDALDFVRALMNAPIPKICIENPVSVISSRIRKPDQIIQPWYWGDDASKKTCLWLKSLPKLTPNAVVCPPKGWKQVSFAFDCLGYDEETGEPGDTCSICGLSYGDDCKCPGPTQEDVVEYKTIEGVLFATFERSKPKPVWSNQTPSGQNKLGPSPDRWKERSKTFPGIAQAMAEQWGGQA